MNIRLFTKLFVLLAGLHSNIGFAVQEVSEEVTKNVETITVEGTRPLSFFKEQYESSRIAIFDSFNELIDEPDMHYVCKRQRRQNSRIMENVCRDAFDIRIRGELFTEEMRGDESFGANLSKAAASASIGSMEIRKLEKEKAELLEQLVKESADFQKVIVNYNKAKFYYEKAHSREFGVLSGYQKETKH